MPNSNSRPRREKILIGITGASGSVYAVSLLRELSRRDCEVHAVFSATGEKVMQFECGLGKSDFPQVVWHEHDNMFAGIASGSQAVERMIVAPCSVNTLSCIAHGISDNLLRRAARVVLKERKQLILVPRETPLDAIILENMLALARAGTVVLPACPAFYHKPDSLEGLIDHVIGKILSVLGFSHDLFPAWDDPHPPHD